ncbi:two-component regulator propeller domain-containing protein [Candidatus Poribacteria bacterium]
MNNNVKDMYRAPDSVMWFATAGGVSHYNGREFVTLPVKADVGVICRDSDGAMWFASWFGGTYRYDTEGLVRPTSVPQPVEGLLGVYSASDGSMWFAWWGYGVSRYDGEKLEQFGKAQGLAGNIVCAISQDADGNLWFGTQNSGVSRYDGKEFVNFTVEDGLAANLVNTVHCAPDGVVWFGTGGGISRYDGRSIGDPPHFVNYTIEDGLVYRDVHAIQSTSDGAMWFGTNGGGACRYDGNTWTSLDARDGLSNYVTSILEDEDGTLWFATADSGVISYRPDATPPQVRITSVRVRRQLYTDLAAIPDVTVGDDVTIEYSAIDFKTVPGKRQYRYQAFRKSLSKKEVDSDWSKPTKSPRFEWIPERSGTYTFEVQAIDRDLNYSEPATLEIKVLPPPFYTRAGFIIGAILVAFFVPSSVLAAVVIRQRRQTFEPISNPYIVGNPIRTKEMFFGRESDFEFVRAKLATGQSGLVIVFAGERRSGKTSILFQILGGALGEQFVPVLMDMQAMTVDSEAEFLEKMASGIDEALVAAGYSPYSTSIDFHVGNPTRTFERFIAQTMETLGDKSLLLLLDEYELIELKIDDGVLRSDLITFFASLLEAHPRLSFVFTGSRHLQRRSTEYWNILIGKSLYRRISFLSEQDAVRLITEPVNELVVYPRGIPERIIRLTAGQPFYTQVMCQNMIDRLNEVERNRVRQEDVDAVAEELANNPLPQMIYFWDGLEREQNDALSLLGEVLEDSNRYASAQMLVNFAQEQKLELELELSDLERVLNDLFVNEMLERERAGEGQYEYRFRADLFRLWVRQAHSVWETA